MSRLTYAVKRAMKMDWHKMRKTAAQLHEKTGKSRSWLMQDMLKCALKYNAGYMDYKIAAMYKLNDEQRSTVITRGISNNIVRRMNNKAFWHNFDDKTTFNTLFAQQVGRKWLRADESMTLDALRAFLEDMPAVLYKPLEGSSGVGIVKYERKDWESDIPQFMDKLRALGPGVLEELLIQHPEMARMCPYSVNTVRIATLLGDKQEGIVYAFLRIGNGKVMDNVDQGGMAARVDLASGKLLTVAADKAGNVYTKHPLTGTEIIGFTIPFFEEAKAMCLNAMHVIPEVRFVAWDVAITANGPRFIEGNSFPSHAVPQFAAHYPDGIGILPEFRKFIDI
ncbi:MAG: hypothetical protein MJ136_01345 [Clostridia bacterium]|nr:hypothetical protein [Clostridia bacterium]